MAVARRNHKGFVSILLPLVVLSFVLFNGNFLRKVGSNIYIYLHQENGNTRHTKFSGSHTHDNSFPAKKLLTNTEETNDEHLILNTGGNQQGEARAVNGITYDENRVLYKYYRATQDPNYECVIRILKYRRPKAEEVYLDNTIWVKSKCEEMPCYIETRYSLEMRDFRDTDVVVLMPGNDVNYEWKKLIAFRPRGQLWTLYSKESPVHEPQFAPPPELNLGNPYNVSMTFRTGSDIDLSYGHFDRDTQGSKAIKSRKTKLIMWMASRCEPLGWERTKFVKEVQKYLPVDIYGKCGTLQCPKRDWDGCLRIMQKYKFYLALENSECSEYITEKFWSNAYATGMVPIAYGAPKEDYTKTAPPNSFIHLDDFRTMQEFVDYIKLLDKNETMYQSFFEWRRLGKTRMGSGFRTALGPPNLCNLVRKLVEVSLYPENSWRGRTPDFATWWMPTCHHQTELLGVRI